VGRVLGIPVALTIPWFLLAALITVGYGGLVSRRYDHLAPPLAYLVGLGLVACLLISVLLHELGHALAARRQGVPVRRVTLDLLGGHTELEHDLPRPAAEAIVALIGPAVSLVLGLILLGAWAVLPDRWAGGDVVLEVALINLVVAGYNALPGLPLDGGRALGAVVWAVSGRRELGDEVAGWTGRVVAAGTFALGLFGYAADRLGALGFLVFAGVAVSLWTGAGQAVRIARTTRRVPTLRAGDLARPAVLVPVATPLSQAPTGVEVGLVDSAGRLVGLVNRVAAAKVPDRQRPWTAVVDVATPVPVVDWLPAGLSGTDLLARISRPDGRVDPSRAYPVALGEDGVGVLRVIDVVRALNGDPPRPATRAHPVPAAPGKAAVPGTNAVSAEPPTIDTAASDDRAGTGEQ
jgi:Zn-dependent protease